MTPTPRGQGVDEKPRAVSPRWAWAQLLKRVFALDLERGPQCQSGTLRIIAAVTYRPVIIRVLAPYPVSPPVGRRPPSDC